MITQPQDATQLVSGMAPAFSAQLATVPRFFANLLQEMLPLAQGGGDPVEVMPGPPLTEKGEAPAKGKNGILSTGGRARGNDRVLGGDGPEPDGIRLVPLSALTGQLPAGQEQVLLDGEAETATPETLPAEGRNNSSLQAEAESCSPVIPFFWGGAVTQLPVTPGATETALLPESALTVGKAQGREPHSVDDRLLPENAVRETLDVPAALGQPRPPVQEEALSKVVNVAAESGPALIPVATSFGEGMNTRPVQQPGQTAAPQPPQRANQAVEAARTAGASVTRESGNGPAQGNQVLHGGVQLPPVSGEGAEVMIATSLAGEARAVTHSTLAERVRGAENLSRLSAVSPSSQEGYATRALPDMDSASGSLSNQVLHGGAQLPPVSGGGAEVMIATSLAGEARAVTHSTLAERVRVAENLSRFSAVNPSSQEGYATRALPDTDSASGSLSNPIVEVLVAEPLARERSSAGKEGNGDGPKQHGQDGAPLAIPGARTADMPLTNRFNLQPKLEETRGALHGSILEQVTASVVSHDNKGNGTITVRLNPLELGELQVNVRIENQHVKVEIITANQTVKEALMGNLDNLKETFLKQHLTMERFDVSSGAGSDFGQGFREERDGRRHISPLSFGQEAASFGIAKESGDEWGETENLLVNLRL